MINHNKNEARNGKIDHIDTTEIDLGLDINTDMLNMKFASV